MPDNSEFRIAGVVLAGGLSRRMGGRDKAIVMLGGKPMIAHALGRLAPQVEGIAINANGDPTRYAGFKAPIIPDMITGHAGPLAGIHAAIGWARDHVGATHVATAAADTPFFPSDLVSRFRDVAPDPHSLVIARSPRGLHPVFGLWPVSLGADLEGWLNGGGSLKVTDWITRHDPVARDFALLESGVDPFFNVNTPAELAQADAALKDMAS